MVTIRSFRNSDPVLVRDLWNKKVQEGPRGFYQINTDILEDEIFGNVLFDPNGFLLAEDDNKSLIGLIHASFLPNETWSAPSNRLGILFPPIVLQNIENAKEVCRSLILAGENYLKTRGIVAWFAGGSSKLPAFYTGLYGHGIPLGFLEKDEFTINAFEELGYNRGMKFRNFQLDTREYTPPVTVRFREATQKYMIRINRPSIARNWWEANLYRNFETREWNTFLRSELIPTPVAGIIVHQIQAPSRSNYSILSDIGVAESCLRSGIGSFLFSTVVNDLNHILRRPLIIETTIVDMNDRLASFLTHHQFREMEGVISFYKTLK